jgi:hypothetical protein
VTSCETSSGPALITLVAPVDDVVVALVELDEVEEVEEVLMGIPV